MSSDAPVFKNGRSARFEYAGEAILAVEAHNCALGCMRALDVDPRQFDPEMPGGSCEILARLALEESPEEIRDHDGTYLECVAREPVV